MPTYLRLPLQIIGLAAAYFIVAKLGLLLAIPPGFASAVWPASGIALVGVLFFGYRSWPGVFLGSFSANALMALNSGIDIVSFNALTVAATIALGASLQAVFGVFLIKKTFLYQPLWKRKKTLDVF